jgi:hypothetical protein
MYCYWCGERLKNEEEVLNKHFEKNHPNKPVAYLEHTSMHEFDSYVGYFENDKYNGFGMLQRDDHKKINHQLREVEGPNEKIIGNFDEEI